MNPILVARDRQGFPIEGTIVSAFLYRTVPCKWDMAYSVDEAKELLLHASYPLVVTEEFTFGFETGANALDVAMRCDVFRLLEFITDKGLSTKVCIVEPYINIPDYLEDHYRSYPCVVEVLGKGYGKLKEQPFRKAIQWASRLQPKPTR